MDELLRLLYPTQWHVLVIDAVVLLAAAELGYRVGRPLFESHDDARRSQIGAVQGALLGLLGLLMGFTFSMGVQRYETRRELVLQEANAIGTTYLRAALLPAAHQTAVEGLLVRYVDARLAFYDAGRSTSAIVAAERTAAALQKELWAHAVTAAREAPTPVTVSFITTLNETIDMDASRYAAMNNRVPGIVWVLLLAVAACGCLSSGYAAGAAGKRAGFPMIVLPLLLAVVMMILVDLSLSRRGFIGVDQAPMRQLKASLVVPPAP